MDLSINIPVKIISGKGCVSKNPEMLALGKKAYIVTGRSAARLCGALDDVISVLDGLGISHAIFSEVRENPSVLSCFEAGLTCRSEGCDFIIGIGGGSALDAAKAIAAFATGDFDSPCDVYLPEKKHSPSLPIALIPTTAGTGSEANNYSVLTLPDSPQKKTFTHKDSWAKVAFLDPRYTYTLSNEYTYSTALDAFHHALESYLSPRSTLLSEMMAKFAAREIWEVISALPSEFTEEMRESLLYASCAAGIAISVTGTGFPHPLGYSLTLLDGVPHGKACAVFAKDYIEYNEKSEVGAKRLSEFFEHIGAKKKAVGDLLYGLADVRLRLTAEEIREHVDLVKNAKNYSNSPYVISYEEMTDIYKRSFK